MDPRHEHPRSDQDGDLLSADIQALIVEPQQYQVLFFFIWVGDVVSASLNQAILSKLQHELKEAMKSELAAKSQECLDLLDIINKNHSKAQSLVRSVRPHGLDMRGEDVHSSPCRSMAAGVCSR